MSRTTTATGAAMAVCVVVPTCGRMDLLDRCLDALSRQTLPADAHGLAAFSDEVDVLCGHVHRSHPAAASAASHASDVEGGLVARTELCVTNCIVSAPEAVVVQSAPPPGSYLARLAVRRLRANPRQTSPGNANADSCVSRRPGRLLHVLDILVTSALIPPLAVFWRLVGAIRYRVRFT